MLKVISNKITLTRGDTGVLNCVVYYSDTNCTIYTLQDGDSLVFTLRTSAKTTSDTDYILQKSFVNNLITILPEDTATLTYGNYIYDVQLTLANGVINTIIPKNIFVLDEEVT